MVAAPVPVVPAAEDFSLYPPEVFLALSNYLDKLRAYALDQYRLGFRLGYAQGRRDGEASASLWHTQYAADEEAEQHYREVLRKHQALARDNQYCHKAANTDPWKRTYEQHIALAWRNGFRMREVQEPFDEDFHPYGNIAWRQRLRDQAWESWQQWMAERQAGREGSG